VQLQVQPHVETVLEGEYRPLVVSLQRSLQQAVETFDAFRRRAEQVAAIAAPGEIRALLAEIEDPEKGLSRRYKGTGFAHSLARIEARLRAALEGEPEESEDPAARTAKTRLDQLADELDQARNLRGEEGPSPLAEMLRKSKLLQDRLV